MARSRKVKINGVQTRFAFNKNKNYKYNKTGNLVEATGTLADDDIIMTGSKSSLRRVSDMERNISILATKMLTTDGAATDSDDDTYGRIESSNIRFKNNVRMDDPLSMRDKIDMNDNKITELATPTASTDAANKAYVDSAASAESKDAIRATAANLYADNAVAVLTSGASATHDTLLEIQNLMATDAELSSAITGLNHDSLAGFVAAEHIDWTTDQGSTNLHAGNYTNTDTVYTHPSNHAISVITGLQAALNDRYTESETDAKIVALSPPATKSHVESLGIAASSITGPLPAIDGSALTGVSAGTLNGYTISVVAEVPSSPVANTIYLVEA